MNCTIPNEIGCPHKDNGECKINNTKCGFYLLEIKPEKIKSKKEKWYEKYYRK